MTTTAEIIANLRGQIDSLRDDNDRLARALTHSTERLAALRAKHERHCREDDERAELLTAERDHHRETLRQLWTSPSFRDVYGGHIRTREPWLSEDTK